LKAEVVEEDFFVVEVLLIIVFLRRYILTFRCPATTNTSINALALQEDDEVK
jgi:hypothetical protein